MSQLTETAVASPTGPPDFLTLDEAAAVLRVGLMAVGETFAQLRNWKVVAALALIWACVIGLQSLTTPGGAGEALTPVGVFLSVLVLRFSISRTR